METPPANAGKTVEGDRPKTICRKHPRECGEDKRSTPTTVSSSETPPRMRGRRLRSSLRSERNGNTPANAGKTLRLCSGNSPRWKHPRECGEDACTTRPSRHSMETPPRMRGRLNVSYRVFYAFRNTPANAGKTLAKQLAKRAQRKHPRECGEDTTTGSDRTIQMETPPRMRGRLTPCH